MKKADELHHAVRPLFTSSNSYTASDNELKVKSRTLIGGM